MLTFYYCLGAFLCLWPHNMLSHLLKIIILFLFVFPIWYLFLTLHYKPPIACMTILTEKNKEHLHSSPKLKMWKFEDSGWPAYQLPLLGSMVILKCTCPKKSWSNWKLLHTKIHGFKALYSPYLLFQSYSFVISGCSLPLKTQGQRKLVNKHTLPIWSVMITEELRENSLRAPFSIKAQHPIHLRTHTYSMCYLKNEIIFALVTFLFGKTSCLVLAFPRN